RADREFLAAADSRRRHDSVRHLRLLSDAPSARGARRRGEPRLVGAHVSDDVRRADRVRARVPFVSGRVSALLARAVIAAAAVAELVAGIRYGTFAASDHDPYGYVSQADAMARGALRVDQRFARAMSWPDAALTFCPPGWRPGTADGFIVPVYSPGLPIA